MKSNRPPAPPPPRRSSSRRRRRRLPPALAALLVVAVLAAVALVAFHPFSPGPANPTGTPGATLPAGSASPAPTADASWTATRPAEDLPADTVLVFAADGRPLLSFTETQGADAGQRVWYAYDAAARLLRKVPLTWTYTAQNEGADAWFGGRNLRFGLFPENGAANALAYDADDAVRLYRAAGGFLVFADPEKGVGRFDAASILEDAPAGPELLTPTKTDDGYDLAALQAFRRSDGWTVTWAARPRFDAQMRFLFYATDRRGFLEDATVHSDLRQTRLRDGTDVVVAQDARPVAVLGDVLVYETRDATLHLRAIGPTGAQDSPDVRWTGALDQYQMFGRWVVFTKAGAAGRHVFGACPDRADGAASFRSIACSGTGRIANLYRVAPDGDTLGLVWLTDRSRADSARLVALSLADGTFRAYDLKAALSATAGGPVDSFSFEGWVSDGAVLVAAVRKGEAPAMRIVVLSDRTPVDAPELSVREEAA